MIQTKTENRLGSSSSLSSYSDNFNNDRPRTGNSVSGAFSGIVNYFTTGGRNSMSGTMDMNAMNENINTIQLKKEETKTKEQKKEQTKKEEKKELKTEEKKETKKEEKKEKKETKTESKKEEKKEPEKKEPEIELKKEEKKETKESKTESKKEEKKEPEKKEPEIELKKEEKKETKPEQKTEKQKPNSEPEQKPKPEPKPEPKKKEPEIKGPKKIYPDINSQTPTLEEPTLEEIEIQNLWFNIDFCKRINGFFDSLEFSDLKKVWKNLKELPGIIIPLAVPFLKKGTGKILKGFLGIWSIIIVPVIEFFYPVVKNLAIASFEIGKKGFNNSIKYMSERRRRKRRKIKGLIYEYKPLDDYPETVYNKIKNRKEKMEEFKNSYKNKFSNSKTLTKVEIKNSLDKNKDKNNEAFICLHKMYLLFNEKTSQKNKNIDEGYVYILISEDGYNDQIVSLEIDNDILLSMIIQFDEKHIPEILCDMLIFYSRISESIKVFKKSKDWTLDPKKYLKNYFYLLELLMDELSEFYSSVEKKKKQTEDIEVLEKYFSGVKKYPVIEMFPKLMKKMNMFCYYFVCFYHKTMYEEINRIHSDRKILKKLDFFFNQTKKKNPEEEEEGEVNMRFFEDFYSDFKTKDTLTKNINIKYIIDKQQKEEHLNSLNNSKKLLNKTLYDYTEIVTDIAHYFSRNKFLKIYFKYVDTIRFAVEKINFKKDSSSIFNNYTNTYEYNFFNSSDEDFLKRHIYTNKNTLIISRKTMSHMCTKNQKYGISSSLMLKVHTKIVCNKIKFLEKKRDSILIIRSMCDPIGESSNEEKINKFNYNKTVSQEQKEKFKFFLGDLFKTRKKNVGNNEKVYGEIEEFILKEIDSIGKRDDVEFIEIYNCMIKILLIHNKVKISVSNLILLLNYLNDDVIDIYLKIIKEGKFETTLTGKEIDYYKLYFEICEEKKIEIKDLDFYKVRNDLEEEETNGSYVDQIINSALEKIGFGKKKESIDHEKEKKPLLKIIAERIGLGNLFSNREDINNKFKRKVRTEIPLDIKDVFKNYVLYGYFEKNNILDIYSKCYPDDRELVSELKRPYNFDLKPDYFFSKLFYGKYHDIIESAMNDIEFTTERRSEEYYYYFILYLNINKIDELAYLFNEKMKIVNDEYISKIEDNTNQIDVFSDPFLLDYVFKYVLLEQFVGSGIFNDVVDENKSMKKYELYDYIVISIFFDFSRINTKKIKLIHVKEKNSHSALYEQYKKISEAYIYFKKYVNPDINFKKIIFKKNIFINKQNSEKYIILSPFQVHIKHQEFISEEDAYIDENIIETIQKIFKKKSIFDFYDYTYKYKMQEIYAAISKIK